MNLPAILRIHDAPMAVFLQPSFSVPRASDTTARVTEVTLQFVQDGAPPEQQAHFHWRDSGRFTQDDEGLTHWTYEADPGPFIIGHEEPERPIIRFETQERGLSAGRWNGTVTARLGAGDDVLTERFCVIVGPGDLVDYQRHGHIDFRADLRGGSPDCYWRPDDWA